MTFWTGMFWSAAAFNIAIAVALGFFAPQVYELWGFDYAPTEHVWRLLSALLIGMFGVAYGLVAIDATLNRNIIILGMFGKLGVVLLIGALYLAGDIPLGVPLTAGGDLLYVILFFVFLYRTRSGTL